MTDNSVLCAVNVNAGTVPPGFCRCGITGPFPSLIGMTRDASGKIICYWANVYYCVSPCRPCPNTPPGDGGVVIG